MPNQHYLLDLVTALSSSASGSLCFLDYAICISPLDLEYSYGGKVDKVGRERIYVSKVEREGKDCECEELCFCARLDVLNERVLGLVGEGRRCLEV